MHGAKDVDDGEVLWNSVEIPSDKAFAVVQLIDRGLLRTHIVLTRAAIDEFFDDDAVRVVGIVVAQPKKTSVASWTLRHVRRVYSCAHVSADANAVRQWSSALEGLNGKPLNSQDAELLKTACWKNVWWTRPTSPRNPADSLASACVEVSDDGS